MACTSKIQMPVSVGTGWASTGNCLPKTLTAEITWEPQTLKSQGLGLLWTFVMAC